MCLNYYLFDDVNYVIYFFIVGIYIIFKSNKMCL